MEQLTHSPYLTYVLFFVASAMTSMLSATVGMAGGTVLLSFLSFFYPFQALIPLHAAVQLSSNFTRTLLLRNHINGSLFQKFILGSLVGVAIGTYALKYLVTSDQIPSLLIALFILYEIFKPKKLPSLNLSQKHFIWVGILIGTLSMMVGATGLLLGLFILGQKGTKEQSVANQAAMQSFNHAAKLVGFMFLGWSLKDQFIPFCFLFLGSVVGTRYGVQILSRMNTKLFFWLFRAVLVLSAIRILVQFYLN